MTLRHLLAAITVAAFPLPTAAHEYTLGPMRIEHPYAIETPPTARTGAGYLSITNTGSAPDRLVAVRTAFPRTEIHTVETDAAGVARMRPVGALDIPAGATITLAPAGLHVMFIGLDAPFAAGAEIPATLVFEGAGELAVEFKVEPRSASDQMENMAH